MNPPSEIIIIGGGIIGLSVAIELKLRGVSVSVLSRSDREAAALAAAGMIAPQAEQIPPSPMLELCLRSRALYADWTQKLEAIAGQETGYWQSGILAPVYQTPLRPASSASAEWLDRETIHQFQPGLGKEVVGGWWYPQDAQVDSRRALVKCLQAAARELGVHLREGIEVTAIERDEDRVLGLQTNQGRLQASCYILAAGAWSSQLFSIPIYPIKGQMLSVRVPTAYAELPLQQAIFGPNIYIVPRRDGLIVVGATVEDVGFTPGATPAGLQELLTRAIQLYPAIARFPIQEFWWGYRPATPDDCPILGASPLENLALATGHYRNGVLLAPISAKLIADWVIERDADPLLASFSWSRFS